MLNGLCLIKGLKTGHFGYEFSGKYGGKRSKIFRSGFWLLFLLFCCVTAWHRFWLFLQVFMRSVFELISLTGLMGVRF